MSSDRIPPLFHQSDTNLRCRWPLGTSEGLSVTCALDRDHDGPHRSAFELFAPVRSVDGLDSQPCGWCQGEGALRTADGKLEMDCPRCKGTTRLIADDDTGRCSTCQAVTDAGKPTRCWRCPSELSGSCQEHGCQWPQGLGVMIGQRDALRKALLSLKRDVEDYGSPRRHQKALAQAERALDMLEDES